MPFIVQQHESIPPAIIVQRFCSMAAETLSSQPQVTVMPPGHFAKVMVQRGTIIMFMPGEAGAWVPIIPVGPGIGIPVIDIPDIGIPDRSIILVVAMLVSFIEGSSCCDPPPSGATGPLWPHLSRISSEGI
jgi:hypothetical protein